MRIWRKIPILLCLILLVVWMLSIQDTYAAESKGIVREPEILTWTDENGDQHSTYAFEVDGHTAFCGDHGKAAPPTGTSHSSYVEVTEERIRQVLHYGYGGVQDEMTRLQYGREKSYVLMAMMITHFRYNEPLRPAEQIFWNHIKDLPKPTKGKAYYVKTRREEMQDLFFYEHPKVAQVIISKTSSRVEISEGNSCYSLEGAQFGIYTDAQARNRIATVAVGKNGMTVPLELPEGTYYLKEEKAPPGFALNPNIYKASLVTGKMTTVAIKNVPQMNQMKLLLRKEDAKTGQDLPGGGATLAGAEFQVDYFPGVWESGTDPEILGQKVKRSWVFRTNAKGIVNYSKEDFVSGDALFYDANGKEALPLGTYRIRERKAPDGYHLQSHTYLVPIRAEGSKEFVTTYVAPIVREESVEVSLQKVQEGTTIPIVGATFEHVRPDRSVASYQTDFNGRIEIRGLTVGIHTIRECAAPDGWEVHPHSIQLQVSRDGKVTMLSKPDSKDPLIRFEQTACGNGVIRMEDRPETISLWIHKENEQSVTLSGAQFALYQDSSRTEMIASGETDSKGELSFSGLRLGTTYYLQETRAPKGYTVPLDEKGNPMVYELCLERKENGSLRLFVNGIEETDVTIEQEREAHIRICNKAEQEFPNTGSAGGILIWMLTISIGLWNLYQIQKQRNKGV